MILCPVGMLMWKMLFSLYLLKPLLYLWDCSSTFTFWDASVSHGKLTVPSPTGCSATLLPIWIPPSPLSSAHSKAGSVGLLPKWMSRQGKECLSPRCRTPAVSPHCSLEVPPSSLGASHLRGEAKSFSLGTPSPSHKASTDCPSLPYPPPLPLTGGRGLPAVCRRFSVESRGDRTSHPQPGTAEKHHSPFWNRNNSPWEFCPLSPTWGMQMKVVFFLKTSNLLSE